MSKDIIIHALRFATKKHKGQKRKFTGDDYITHPIHVADLLSKFGGTTEMLATAILHDVLEDTDTTYEELRTEFGTVIADWVKELTTDYIEDKSQKGKILAEKMRKMSPEALTIKLTDRFHNVKGFTKASPRFIRLYKAETELIIDSIKDILTETQLSIVNEIRKVMKPYE